MRCEEDGPRGEDGRPVREKLSMHAGGLAVTIGLVLLALLCAAAGLAALVFAAIAMPLTTASLGVVLAVAALAAWRLRRRRH